MEKPNEQTQAVIAELNNPQYPWKITDTREKSSTWLEIYVTKWDMLSHEFYKNFEDREWSFGSVNWKQVAQACLPPDTITIFEVEDKVTFTGPDEPMKKLVEELQDFGYSFTEVNKAIEVPMNPKKDDYDFRYIIISPRVVRDENETPLNYNLFI